MTNRPKTLYNIICQGSVLVSNLTEEQFFDEMEGLAQSYYSTGMPDPSEITFETIEVNGSSQ
jgi:hypothetical protein